MVQSPVPIVSEAVGKKVFDDFLRIGVEHRLHAPALLAHVGRALGQAMALIGGLELDLAGRGELEALFGAALRLHLGHFQSFEIIGKIGRVAACPIKIAGTV